MHGQDRDALEHWTVRRGQSEDARQLGDEDVRRDAREKADRHRYRGEIRDPAETENCAGDEHETDHERQRGGEPRVLGLAGRGQDDETSATPR
jgi:hypothetical protein